MFGSARVLVAALKRDIGIISQSKTNYGLFPKKLIEDSLKNFPGSANTALEDKHPDGSDLVTVSYKCNSKLTLYFVITKNAGSIRKGSLF